MMVINYLDNEENGMTYEQPIIWHISIISYIAIESFLVKTDKFVYSKNQLSNETDTQTWDDPTWISFWLDQNEERNEACRNEDDLLYSEEGNGVFFIVKIYHGSNIVKELNVIAELIDNLSDQQPLLKLVVCVLVPEAIFIWIYIDLAHDQVQVVEFLVHNESSGVLAIGFPFVVFYDVFDRLFIVFLIITLVVIIIKVFLLHDVFVRIEICRKVDCWQLFEEVSFILLAFVILEEQLCFINYFSIIMEHDVWDQHLNAQLVVWWAFLRKMSDDFSDYRAAGTQRLFLFE